MAALAAEICRAYGIPVTPQRILGHEEWDSIHGKKQDRWDVNCIPHLDIRPGNPLADGTHEAMNWMRERIASMLGSDIKPPQFTELESGARRDAFRVFYADEARLPEIQPTLNQLRRIYEAAGVKQLK
jgi:hypothetical protein